MCHASDSGLASGLVNTSFMMGGALGLAVLASLAAAQTHKASALGVEGAAALNAGYQLAFGVGAGFAILAALIGGVMFGRSAAPANAATSAGAHGI